MENAEYGLKLGSFIDHVYKETKLKMAGERVNVPEACQRHLPGLSQLARLSHAI